MHSHSPTRLSACARVLIKPLASILAVVGLVSAAGGAEERSPFTTDVSLSEIMESIVMPAADLVWNAVTYDSGPNGVVEHKPQTDEEWARLRQGALSLATATNLLMIPNTPIVPAGQVVEEVPGELGPAAIAKLQQDNWQAWVAHAVILHQAALQAIEKIDAKDADGLSEVGGTIDEACESCHLQFWYPSQG